MLANKVENIVKNQHGQPIGTALPDWHVRAYPQKCMLTGQYCRLEPLSLTQHADDLFMAFHQASDDSDWTYMFANPLESERAFLTYLTQLTEATDALHFAIIDLHSQQAVGTFALMRIDRTNGVVEMGYVSYSPRLKRSRVATEAQYLMMQYVFEKLGYRRYEWKCDALNQPSRDAALRLGFKFEGIFRQAVVYKARNRDTAWFSIIDKEWPTLANGFRAWLSANNFTPQGEQLKTLATFF